MVIRTYKLGKNKFITFESYYRPSAPVLPITASVVGVLLTLSTIYSVMRMNEPDIIPIPVQPYKPSTFK